MRKVFFEFIDGLLLMEDRGNDGVICLIFKGAYTNLESAMDSVEQTFDGTSLLGVVKTSISLEAFPEKKYKRVIAVPA